MKEKFAWLQKTRSFIIRFRYIITVGVFVLWIFFFDTNNIIYRFKRLNTLNRLNKEIEMLEKDIETYSQQYNELFSDKKDLEKFAREQFLMKNDDEDIFIVVNLDGR